MTEQPEDPVDDVVGVEPGGAEPTSTGTEATQADQRLLARAQELGTLDLAERPDAFAELDQAIVAELRAIEDL